MKIEHPNQLLLPGLKQLWQEAFGDGADFADGFFQTAFSPERCRCVVENGQPVGALYWLDCCFGEKKVAYVYAVATAKTHRGKGICRRLMEDTHGHLAALGYAGALLVPGNEGLRAMYRAMGYADATRVSVVRAEVGERTLLLRPLTGEEYGHLRRPLLPADGVLQEGTQLAYLAAQWELYGSREWLLAGLREGRHFHGMEFLGDPEKLPAVLAALDCDTGTFRMPGDQLPFAMIHPLERMEVPGYFGLAFD